MVLSYGLLHNEDIVMNYIRIYIFIMNYLPFWLVKPAFLPCIQWPLLASCSLRLAEFVRFATNVLLPERGNPKAKYRQQNVLERWFIE